MVCAIILGRSDVITRRGYGYDIVRTVLKTLRDNGELAGAVEADMLDE